MSFEIRAQKKKQKPFLMFTSLPNDVITDILARVPICDYPILSLVSKQFHSLVSSDELYARRSLLGCTEACLYAVIYNQLTSEWCLYILRQKANIDNNCLVCIKSLPLMLSNASFAVVGSRIYALSCQEKTSRFLSIDCRSHTVQPLPSIPMPMFGTIAGTTDGKIYFIGHYRGDWKKKVMVVFNIKTQMWEHEITQLDGDMKIGYPPCTGMADKIYMRDYPNSFVYYPKENKWETDEMLDSENWKTGCVVNDVLYYFDIYGENLRAYDPKKRRWGVVKVAERFVRQSRPCWSSTVNYGGNLVVLFNMINGGIWCAEIILERRQEEEEICGEVKWRHVVLNGNFGGIESLVVII